MNISGHHRILVSNVHLQEAQKIVRDKQNQAVRNGWKPAAGAPTVRVEPANGQSAVIFDAPLEVLEAIKGEVDLFDRVVDVIKDICNGVENLARKIWPF